MAPRRKTDKEEVSVPDASISSLFLQQVAKRPDHQALSDYCKIYGFSLQHALPLQYALGSNVLPLGQFILLVGPPHQGKTTFMWELNRVVLANNGMVNLVDTEGRVGFAHLNGILQMAKEELDSKIIPYHASDLDELKEIVMDYTVKYIKICSQFPVWQPLSVSIDSLSNITSAEAVAATVKDAASSNNMEGAQNANLLTKFMCGFVPSFIHRLPILLVAVNHQKTKISTGGKPSYIKTDADYTTGKGGDHKDFQAQYTFQVTSSATKEAVNAVTNTVLSSYDLHLKLVKCSTGPKQRKITVPVVSEYDYDQLRVHMDKTGCSLADALKQVNARNIVLDWNTSLVNMLLNDKVPIPHDAIKKLLGLRGSASNRRYAEALGITEASTDRAIGEAIHANADMVRELGMLMGVDQSGLIWHDYAQELTPLYNALLDRAVNRYGA